MADPLFSAADGLQCAPILALMQPKLALGTTIPKQTQGFN